MLPLYDWETFSQYYQRQYSENSPPGAAWFASLNVVLGIGGMISDVRAEADGRVPARDSAFMRNIPNMEYSPYSRYFRNAASCFIELTFHEPSLMTVQALCGMVTSMYSKSALPTNRVFRHSYSVGLPGEDLRLTFSDKSTSLEPRARSSFPNTLVL